jgi:transposase
MSSNPEVRPKATRRIFGADEKARILAEYDSASTPLMRASLMRREGVYSSLLSNWRKQLAAGAPPKRGRPANPDAAEVARLRNESVILGSRFRAYPTGVERRPNVTADASFALRN